MRRRQFITLLGGAAAWPVAARAQQPVKLPTIGILGVGSPASWGSWIDAFVQRLRELGWIDGHSVAIEYRWAEGRSERFTEIAAELVRLKVDVILTGGSAGFAAKQATSTIPIVLAVANDPVGAGLVESLAHPGGNVTGLSLVAPDLAGKRLGFLREASPAVRRLAILANVDQPAAVIEMREVETTARALGLDVLELGIRHAEDIAPAIESITTRAGALYVCTDALIIDNRFDIGTLASTARLLTVSGVREILEAGGLISYGPNPSDMFRRAAEYVDKILHGTNPGGLPVEQPTKFELLINLKSAKALGITIPPNLLALADEVIE